LNALLPRLPGSEPLDRRIAAAFLVLGLALLAPSLPGVFEPTDQDALANTRDTLESEVRQVLTTIDARPRTTEMYFRTAIEDLGDRAEGIHGELAHRDVQPQAARLRDTLAKVADDLASVAEELTTAYGDDAAIAEDRSRVEDLRTQLESLGSAQS
jgi:hypothetical protein